MPIIVNDYKWRETDTTITIHVPLHGIHKSKVDLLTWSGYIKASFEKFFFELFLQDDISVQDSICTIGNTEIIYELEKVVHVKWERLERILSKPEKKIVRQQAFDSVSAKVQEDLEKWRTKKDQLKRTAVTQAVRVDNVQRNKIAQIKEEEKCNALGDIKQWRKEVVKKVKPLPIKAKKIIKPIPKPEVHVPIPLPRSNAVVNVDFTPRVLPTPCRESQEEEENDWLSKQAAARRSAGFVSEDLRPEEKNPQYLLAKGDEFMKNKNLLGALSAYTFGIQISPQFVDLYIQRAEAHYEIGNYNKCINDCSSAIDLMKPEVLSNLEQRAICIGRRGMALHQLGMKRQALDELKASLMLKGIKIFGEYYYKILEETETDE